MLDDFEARMEKRDLVIKALGCLTEQQEDFIVRHYFCNETLASIAADYGMTNNKIRQFDAQAIWKMRRYLRLNYRIAFNEYDVKPYSPPIDRTIADNPMRGSSVSYDVLPVRPDFIMWLPEWLPQHIRDELEQKTAGEAGMPPRPT